MTIVVIIDGLVVVLAQQLNRVVDTFEESNIRCKLKIKTEYNIDMPLHEFESGTLINLILLVLTKADHSQKTAKTFL